MKIGFYFEASKKSGGAYQYALNMLEALREISEHSYVVFNLSPDFPFETFKLPNWEIINLINVEKLGTINSQGAVKKEPLRRKAVNYILHILRVLKLYYLEIYLTRKTAQIRAHQFSKKNIDLMIFHGPSELSFLTKIPGIVPIHDLEHRRHSIFPELRTKGQWQRREYTYNHIKKTAWRILVDSPVGKADVIEFYHVAPERIEIVPFLPPSYLNPTIAPEIAKKLCDEHKLPERFLFYPAQFWPHKNHRNLVKALAALKKEGVTIPIVFVGTKQEGWGEYQIVMKTIEENNMQDQIHFLGYVSNEEMSAFYKRAEALVMPTFLGPTNIPVYEAWRMGCPVLYSNIRGPREQAGDAAILFDPYSPEDIARAIKEIWGNTTKRNELIEKGSTRLTLWTWQNFYDKMRELINTFKEEHA